MCCSLTHWSRIVQYRRLDCTSAGFERLPTYPRSPPPATAFGESCGDRCTGQPAPADPGRPVMAAIPPPSVADCPRPIGRYLLRRATQPAGRWGGPPSACQCALCQAGLKFDAEPGPRCMSHTTNVERPNGTTKTTGPAYSPAPEWAA